MKKKRNITSPIILAVLCAVGVHTVLFTDAGHRLQSSIIESDTSSHAEAHLVASETSLSLKVNVTATNVTQLEWTLNYDDTSLTLNNPSSPFGTISTTDIDFGEKVMITFDKPTNFTKWTTLATWELTTLLPESHTINLTDVKLSMTDGNSRLTTEWTGEF